MEEEIELTDAERVAGFEIGEIETPSNYGGPSVIPAIVCWLDDQNRVLRKRTLQGRVCYIHEQLGRLPSLPESAKPKWTIVNDNLPPDPRRAVQAASAGRGGDPDIRKLPPNL